MTVSMTAFARCDQGSPWGELAWELRTVNHRYLDISLRLPEVFRPLEPGIRDAAAKYLKRGKLDATLYFRPGEAGAGELALDETLLHQLVDLAHRVEVVAHNVSGLRTADLLRWPGVVKGAEVDNEGLRQAAMDLLQKALEELMATRRREGAQIAELIRSRLDGAQTQVDTVRGVLPEITRNYRERLEERLAEIKEQVDPARLEQEIVLFAQRTDVAEELDRLEAHLQEVRRVVDGDGPVGRRLDFLMQELNREANTLGSKAADIRLTNASVELKVLIEQMREQIQNIE
jgi:uncharacterized protein (TIGR00255 family)